MEEEGEGNILKKISCDFTRFLNYFTMSLVQKKSRNLSVFTQYKDNTYELIENDVNDVLKNSISSCIKSRSKAKTLR